MCIRDRNSTDVQGISGGSLVSADAPFAQDDVGVALRDNVLSCIEPLVNGCLLYTSRCV